LLRLGLGQGKLCVLELVASSACAACRAGCSACVRALLPTHGQRGPGALFASPAGEHAEQRLGRHAAMRRAATAADTAARARVWGRRLQTYPRRLGACAGWAV